MLEGLIGKAAKHANVNYAGMDGVTESCKTAIRVIVETQGVPEKAIAIARGSSRGFLLVGDDLDADTVVVAGFGAGYAGEGPSGFAWAQEFLVEAGAMFNEVQVDQAFMARLGERDLRVRDIEFLKGEA